MTKGDRIVVLTGSQAGQSGEVIEVIVDMVKVRLYGREGLTIDYVTPTDNVMLRSCLVCGDADHHGNEPCCPACRHHNALLGAYADQGQVYPTRVLKCRDCGYVQDIRR
jgi:hypothetical protein